MCPPALRAMGYRSLAHWRLVSISPASFRVVFLGSGMAEYHLLSTWQIEAPLDAVYAEIFDSLHWPEWWPGLQEVVQTAAGDAGGIGSKRGYSWRGKLPYVVEFEVCTTRIENCRTLAGAATGDLEGSGCWRFGCQDSVSVAQFEWRVRITKWWWKLLEPLARPLFIRNHGLLMAQGAQGLARRLHAVLRHQESIDLATTASPPTKVHRLDPDSAHVGRSAS
jgi:hypothetical protein